MHDPNKPWFQAKAQTSGDTKQASITIDGEIGRSWWDDDSVASSEFMNAVNALGDLDEIIIGMNSPGGSVTDGLTIANYLRAHKARVIVNVLGQASSISSVITAAADEVNMGLGSFGLLHNPWTFAMGNADQFRELAGNLDKISSGMMSHYLARAGEKNRARLEQLIKGESGEGTLLSADEWVEIGLADRVMNDVKAAASTSQMHLMTAMQKAQQQAAEKIRANQPSKPPQGKTSTKEESMTLEELKAKHPELVQAMKEEMKAAALADTQARADTAKAEAVTAERARAAAIIVACQTTNQPQLVAKLIENGMAEDQAKEYVFDVAAASGNKTPVHTSHGDGLDPNAASDASRILANYRAVTGAKQKTA